MLGIPSYLNAKVSQILTLVIQKPYFNTGIAYDKMPVVLLVAKDMKLFYLFMGPAVNIDDTL